MNKGVKFTDKHKENISKSLIGKFKGKTYEEIMGEDKAKETKKLKSNKFSGTGNPFYNKKHKNLTKEIMSKLKANKTHKEIMGKENAKSWKQKMSGENSPLWKGGYSVKDYKNFTNLFKRKIRQRDNQICMTCGIHREKLKTALSIHHIDYNKQNSIPQNCISLCNSCHSKTNYNTKHWISFFQQILTEKYSYKYSKDQEVIIEYA